MGTHLFTNVIKINIIKILVTIKFIVFVKRPKVMTTYLFSLNANKKQI